jgi:hypothetical protein
MPRPVRRSPADPRVSESAFDAAFAEATGARPSEVVVRPRVRSEVVELTVPPDQRPSRDNLPGSIEEAVLAALDQVPRSATLPPPARSGDATGATDTTDGSVPGSDARSER